MDKTSPRDSLNLSVLPPLLLHAVLPPSYPLHSPPEIVSLRATHMWIPNIEVLQTALTEMWRIGEQVLYNWVEYIRNGDFLQTIKLTEDSVIMCVSLDDLPKSINQLIPLGFLIKLLVFFHRYFQHMNYHRNPHNSLRIHTHALSVSSSSKDTNVYNYHASISFVGLASKISGSCVSQREMSTALDVQIQNASRKNAKQTKRRLPELSVTLSYVDGSG
jgi:RWD domain